MKPYAVYGKKPRGSKTSKRETINGVKVFLHFSKAGTGGNIVVYADIPPYPRLIVSSGNTYMDAYDKAVAWVGSNRDRILTTINSLDPNYGLDKDLLDNINSPKKQRKEKGTR